MICLMLSHVRFSVAGSCAMAFQKLLIQSTFRVAMISSYTARTSGLASWYSISLKVAIASPLNCTSQISRKLELRPAKGTGCSEWRKWMQGIECRSCVGAECRNKPLDFACLAGAQRFGQLEIRLQPAINLHRSVARTDYQFALAPRANRGQAASDQRRDAVNQAVVGAHKTQALAARTQLWRQIVQVHQRRKIPSGNLAILHAGSG